MTKKPGIRGRSAIVMMAVLFGLVACGSSSSTAGSSSVAPKPSPIADCRGSTETNAPSAAPPTGVSYVSMTIDGKLRDYRLFLPSTLDSTKPAPLVIVFHGSPIDAAGFEGLIHFDQEASTGGFIEASPNGCGGFWDYAEGRSKVTDEHFVAKMLEQLESKYAIDRARVFLVGASAGTWVEYRLACDMAGLVSAIASIAGTMRLTDDCQPSRPVSILEMHGTQDNVHPWRGGGPHDAFPVEDVMQRWSTLDRCKGNPTVNQNGITETSEWNQCSGGAVVRLDKVMHGHHTWFGSDLDPVQGEPSANSVIWSFFSSLKLRA